jgi:uncharacterized protein with HEPN domain
MKHPERAEDYLAHIAEAIERATGYVQALPDRAALERNPIVQDAVVRNIEIIGEAATQLNRMAPEFVAQHPELPWDNMRDMRNAAYSRLFQRRFRNCLADGYGGFAEAITRRRPEGVLYLVSLIVYATFFITGDFDMLRSAVGQPMASKQKGSKGR